MKKIYIIYELLFTVILITGCNIQNQSAKVILTEDFDDKPLDKYNQSRWQSNSHTTTEFNTPGGGKYEYDCLYKRTMKGLYQSKNLIIPLIFRACREPIDRFKAPVVLYFHGGPYAYSVKNPSTVQDIFIKNGFTIVEPLYRGASERPWNFVKAWGAISTFVDTRREVLELVDFYHRNGRNIIFAGDSFGGLIISSVFLNMKKSDYVVMFGPALSPVADIFSRQNRDIKISDKELTEINLFCKQANIKNCDDPEHDLLKNIFGSYANFSPVRNYRGQKLAPQIYVVSGADDKIVGVDDAKRFAAAFPDSVHHLIVPDLGHADLQNIRQFNQIEKFLRPVLKLSIPVKEPVQ